MQDFAWDLFLKTGSIESYLLYKEITDKKTERGNGIRKL
ncbi:MAG: YqzL family protein [Clostridia bacterium]|nr:YqzL family protein [Clostridia bacterium]